MHSFVLGDGFCADPDDLQAAQEVFLLLPRQS